MRLDAAIQQQLEQHSSSLEGMAMMQHPVKKCRVMSPLCMQIVEDCDSRLTAEQVDEVLDIVRKHLAC